MSAGLRAPRREDEAVERGVALQRAGKAREAEAQFAAVLRQNARHPEANNAMGSLALQAEKFDVAISFFRNALAAKPHEARYLNNLGLAFCLSGKPEEGLPVLLAALRVTPTAYEILCNVGRCYWQLGIAFEGIPYLEKAVKQHPDRVEGLLLIADAKISAGENDEAEAICRRVLEMSPLNPGALNGIAAARKQTAESNIVPEIVAALEANPSDESVTRGLNYSAAKSFIDLKDADNAFKHLAGAKSQKRIDRAKEEARLRRLKILYNPVFLKAREKLGVRDRTPVFIVGMPRSGTSLTEQIISSHPQVFGAGELGYMHNIANQLLFSMPTLDVYAGRVASLTERAAQELAGYYLKKIRGFSADATVITDKMPHNFLHVGLIALLLPEARIIHCKRNPLDNCFSIYTNNFNERHAYAHHLEDLGWYYRQYARLMEHWSAMLPQTVLEVQYEDLVDDLEAQTRRMLDFLGLPFDEACLDFQNNRRSVTTISRAQVRQPLYRTSIERWRPYEKHLGPLIAALAGD